MSEPFLSEIKIMSFNFAPKGWALCNGQLLPINQNQALFSLLGTTYGGDGRVNFALPDLRSRIPMSFSGSHTLGERAGAESVTINQQSMPQHLHFMQVDATTAATSNVVTPSSGNSLGSQVGKPSSGSNFQVDMFAAPSSLVAMAPQSVSNVGGSQAHENRQPVLALNFCIALQGIFPSQT
ncbi:MAG TPA: tail fiber protein [Allosphingosinicella sp.]|nr:tail fiber protein [Allosphingosinicella sp.]